MSRQNQDHGRIAGRVAAVRRPVWLSLCAVLLTASGLAAQTAPSREYVYMGGRVIAVENAVAFVVSPLTATSPAGGGLGSISVTAAAGTAWQAVSSHSWLVITSGASGVGSGTVSYNVAANTGAARTATITVTAGTSLALTLTQDPAAAQPPVNVSVTPTSASGTSQVFTFTASSPNGYGYIDHMQMILNYTLHGSGGCYLYYDRSSNILSLAADDGYDWLWSGPIGSPGVIENSRCRVFLGASTVAASGDHLAVSLALSAKPAALRANMNETPSPPVITVEGGEGIHVQCSSRI